MKYFKMERKIIFYSKLPASIKEGFEQAMRRDELESTTVAMKGESKLGLIYSHDEISHLVIMDQPLVQDINEEDEVDFDLQDEME